MRNLFILSSALLIPCVSAQELTLFEQVEVDQAAAEQFGQPTMGVQPNGAPAFTLRGTSRFGDLYSTTLIDRNGQTVKVNWRAGESVEIPGFTGFNVVGVSSGSVSLQHPAGDTCVVADASGVQCSSASLAVLGLTKTMPLATNGTPPVQNQNPFAAQAGAASGYVNAEGQQIFTNPFTGEPQVAAPPSPDDEASRAERQQRRNERRNQFTPVRIAPEDVPPGMRLVVTPFGDRIVPAQ